MVANHLPYRMRAACVNCGNDTGHIRERGAQDCVYCELCDRWQYNAPRTETGKKVRSVSSVHDAIKPKQRVRVIQRANAMCELCGARGDLHVGHILSVSVGLEFGIEDELLNHDENLMSLCSRCNLGMGAEPMPLRLAVALLRARVSWSKGER